METALASAGLTLWLQPLFSSCIDRCCLCLSICNATKSVNTMLHEQKGYDSGGWARERERGPAWFDLCYAMQSNRETAQMKGLGWNSSVGWRLWFCIGVRRALWWISCISHTRSCPPCHKNNKHAAKGTRGALQARRRKQNVLSWQQCGANRRFVVVNIYPSAPTSKVKSNSTQAQSLVQAASSISTQPTFILLPCREHQLSFTKDK